MYMADILRYTKIITCQLSFICTKKEGNFAWILQIFQKKISNPYLSQNLSGYLICNMQKENIITMRRGERLMIWLLRRPRKNSRTCGQML